MLTIPETETEATVFTALYAGLYSFVAVYALANQNGEFFLNGTLNGGAASPQGAFTWYMASGDVMSYLGHACQLAGNRQGNEFDDP